MILSMPAGETSGTNSGHIFLRGSYSDHTILFIRLSDLSDIPSRIILGHLLVRIMLIILSMMLNSVDAGWGNI